MSRELENKIKDLRTIEANQKNLVGPTGKLGIIVRMFGQPIIDEGGGIYEVDYLDYDQFSYEGFYETTVSKQRGPSLGDNRIHESDEDVTYRCLGYFYNALSAGINMEIRSEKDEDHFSLQVIVEGSVVYQELNGDLEQYVPGDWEKKVNSLYRVAEKRLEGIKKNMAISIKQEAEENKQGFLQRLKERWGFKS